MTRDALKSLEWFDQWISYDVRTIERFIDNLAEPTADPNYRPRFLREVANKHLSTSLRHYSRGDHGDVSQNLWSLLQYWEQSERLGKSVWTPEQQYTRHTWAVNLDHYIDCFWLIGLALALKIPEAQWQRLLALVGNEGEDLLLDRVIATRSPDRKIGTTLCYPKPYARLLAAIDAPKTKQALLLDHFVEHWYKEIGNAAKSARQKQAIPFKTPYWHNYHRLEGGYFGYWCVEAVAAVKAFNLDDSLCVGHPHYPGDLLRPGQVTSPDLSRLLPELAVTIGAPSEKQFSGEPRHLTKWEALKMLVKNKLNA
ncbi:hypothetical protein H6CHR_03121 [Variovorax sp. PBL-H6]|uniref:PoNi-like cognate immunity protein n=1 Tax=Variovorax sp. PBL-H6 TaxID=434009 RepID=UPI001319AB25|nr:PoNi-like cognate immunity protein [Variovorax sp. PBL-H6]VTU29077.1 hypothetical protein H6CHR_03121 [Variovorax sp. PBL-H6]